MTVISAASRFCQMLEKEKFVEVERGLSRLARVQYSKALFRKKNYGSHHKRMLGESWSKCIKLHENSRSAFFTIGFCNPSHARLQIFCVPRSRPRHFLIDKNNVAVIIGEMKSLAGNRYEAF